MPKFITTVERPILTPEEREKRMKAIRREAERLIIARERVHSKRKD